MYDQKQPVPVPLSGKHYAAEMETELLEILSYWKRNTPDQLNGGFHGSVNQWNVPDPTAAKGVVLHARICWSFSAAYRLNKNPEDLQMADRAFHYIVEHFVDHEWGGVFWSVNHKGAVLDDRKQIYGLAFCIYGLSEYYKVTENGMALHLAKDLYDYIERYSADAENGGYVEAFSREWRSIEDLRLSEKDENEKKTVNTHLHIIEAYANLYQVWPDKNLSARILNLLHLFHQYFINPVTGHLNLFMDDHWQARSTLQSFGHDIEAAWLLLQCANSISAPAESELFRQHAITLANAAIEGLDEDGGLWYEYEPINGQLIREKHSWPQAEAMIGFLHVWQLTGDHKYWQYSMRAWEFVKNHIRDNEMGEWFWGVKEDYSIMEKDKAGFWKCPYHNSRACMEIIQLLRN